MSDPNSSPNGEKSPAQSLRSDSTMVSDTSPGVKRMEVLTRHFTLLDRVLLFLGVFLAAYAYGLDGQLRIVYTPYATGSFKNHSLLSTVNVIRAVVAAAAQPTAAKLSDVFGRMELVLTSVVFYIIGTVIEAACNDVASYAAGAVFYQIGYTIIVLMVEVIVADATSLRARLLFSYIPAAPFIINAWVSGDVSSAVLGVTSWRWGLGMWAIIYPACTLPLVFALWNSHRRAKKAADLDGIKVPYQGPSAGRVAMNLFWSLDVIGVILLIAVFSLILVPFTLAGGVSSSWKSAHIIAPLVVGILCIPAWVIWEMKCPQPMVPFRLLKNRGVWGALGIGVFLNFAWYLQGDFLYTVLVVSFNQSVLSATRISSLYSFVSTLTGLCIGAVVYYIKRLKIFVVAGTTLFLLAFGLLIHYRGGTDGASYSGVIGAEVLLGIAGGMFPYTTMASIQAATKHEHVAVITGLYLACYNIGSALGNTVSGAIWTQLLPGKLLETLGDEKLAAKAYADPLGMAEKYSVGTPERAGIIEAYMDTQRILCICGICLCLPLIFFSVVLRNPKLGDEQSLAYAEKSDSEEEEQQQGGGIWAWLTR